MYGEILTKWMPIRRPVSSLGSHKDRSFTVVVCVFRVMSVTQWGEVEVKVHRLCQEFNHIHRGTIKQIFHLCNLDEEHCRRMLQTFNSPSGHPSPPERQFSAPSSNSPLEGAVDIPKQSVSGGESKPIISQSVSQPSPVQPAATINLTLDDVMRLLHMTADQYDGRTLPGLPYRQQPLYHMPRGRGGTIPRMHYPAPPPHPVSQRPPAISPMKRDFSKILEAQQRQIDEMKQALSDVKKGLSSLERDAEEKNESLNKIGLRVLQGIQDSTLEEKQIFIQTLEADIQILTRKKDYLEDRARHLEPRQPSVDPPKPPNSTPQVWSCQYCTYDNEMGVEECTVCHFKRGTKPNSF